MWRVGGQDARALVKAFEGIRSLYIADGHHRVASAARARIELRGQATQDAGEWDSFLAVAFPDAEVQILPYNRVVKDLGALTPAAFLERLRARFEIIDGPATPVRRGHVAVFVAHRWYTLLLGEPPAAVSPAGRLDVSRLQDLVIEPMLGISDVRSDKRIDFVGGARGTGELERQVTSGAAAVAFSMHPVGIEDLMSVCDGGGIMPPKSTWFEPKLRDGLLSHVL
jgi:uncharacterized protein (DUF1015 family)